MTATEAEEMMYLEMRGKGYDVFRWDNVPKEKTDTLHLVIKANSNEQGRIWDKIPVYVLGYVPDKAKGAADIEAIKAMERAIAEPYFHKEKVTVYGGTTCKYHASQVNRQPETELKCQLVSVMFLIEYQNFKF